MMEQKLIDSFEYCRALTRRHARNFYYGMKLTPQPKRSAMYAVYAWMRTADDLADDQHDTEQIEVFMQKTDRAIEGGEDDEGGGVVEVDQSLHAAMWPAVCEVFRGYPIQREHLHAMIAGQQSDLGDQHIETFEELYQYCYRVASVVGLVSIAVWGHDDEPRVAEWAEQRGIAFQLTNILRDVAEDAQRGRVYLPREDLKRFNYSEDDLKRGIADDRFESLMRFEIERAQNYYEQSAPLESHLCADCRSTSMTLQRIYHTLLQRIARDPRKVLQQRVRVPAWRKLTISLQGRLGW